MSKMNAVIVAHRKDIETLDLCIEGIRNNIVDVGKDVIVVSEAQFTDNAIWYDEQNFPFKIPDVAAIVGEKRAGWYFQQLLKLYSALILPGISKKIVIVDADTIFLNKVVLDGFSIVNTMHKPYFDHMDLLLPGLVKQVNYSGTVHYMVYSQHIISDLMKRVEDIHQKFFWETYLDCINPKEYKRAGASEQEIYFHFTLMNYGNYKLQRMKCAIVYNLSDIENYERQGYHCITSHDYLRQKK